MNPPSCGRRLFVGYDDDAFRSRPLTTPVVMVMRALTYPLMPFLASAIPHRRRRVAADLLAISPCPGCSCCCCPCSSTPRQKTPDLFDSLYGALQPLQPLPLLDIAALQDGHTLLQLRACLPLRSHHFIGLLEELRAQLL